MDGNYDREFPRLRTGCAIKKLAVLKDDGDSDTISDAKYDRLCEAANMARDWVNAAFARIDGFYEGTTRRGQRNGWRDDRQFSHWFGAGDRTNRQIRLVHRRLKQMAKWFNNGLRIVVVQAVETGVHLIGKKRLCGNQAAYTLAPVIYLCPGFFEDRRTASRNATTLVHEVTHRLVQSLPIGGRPWVFFGHPLVKGGSGVKRTRLRYNSQADLARTLAERRPWVARRSPVNYALLCREIGTGERPRNNDPDLI